MQSNLLRGVPLQTTSTYGPAPTGLQNAAGIISGIGGFARDVSGLFGESGGLGSLFSGIKDWWNGPEVFLGGAP